MILMTIDLISMTTQQNQLQFDQFSSDFDDHSSDFDSVWRRFFGPIAPVFCEISRKVGAIGPNVA